MEICKICNNSFKSIKALSKHIKYYHSPITPEVYYKTYVDQSAGTCRTCGNPTIFIGLGKGYRSFCCSRCSTLNDETKKKYNDTNIQKYGVPNAMQNKDVQNKIKSSFINKYGVDNPMKSNIVKEKLAETNKEKYGCSCALANPDVKNKAITTMKEKYGVEYTLESVQLMDKFKNTMRKRYGSEFSLSSGEISGKIEKTNITKYGKSNPASNDIVRNSIKKTNNQKYGGSAPICSNRVKEKITKTMIEKYGFENPGRLNYRYKYNDLYFDSSWELAFYIWNIDQGKQIVTHPNKKFFYEINGKQSFYEPDFYVDNKYIEIKGTQFFRKDNGEFFNPFDSSQNEKYKAKFKCMIDNGIQIITDCSIYVSYVKENYGPKYLEQFRTGNRK